MRSHWTFRSLSEGRYAYAGMAASGEKRSRLPVSHLQLLLLPNEGN
jgi:hypothetical protein